MLRAKLSSTHPASPVPGNHAARHTDPGGGPAKPQAAIVVGDTIVLGGKRRQPDPTPATLVLRAQPQYLLDFVKQGHLDPYASVPLGADGLPDNLQATAGNILELTAGGKRALAQALGDLDLTKALASRRAALTAKGMGHPNSIPVPPTLQLRTSDIVRVLMPPDRHVAFMALYGAAAAEGQAPARINGRPFQTFFQATEDAPNALLSDAFRTLSPAFARKSPQAQQAMAALAGQLAAAYPAEVDASTRYRLALGQVHHQAIASTVDLSRFQHDGEIRSFHHGRDGAATRSPLQEAQEGFRAGPRASYGSGVYYGSTVGAATVAGSYGFQGENQVGAILSGEVAVGKVTSPSLSTDATADSAFVRQASAEGDYWVTRDPGRFKIENLTTYNPTTPPPARLATDLLKVYPKAPDWASFQLARLPATTLQRTLARPGAQTSLPGDFAQRLERNRGVVRALQGDPRGLSDALAGLEDPDTGVQSRAQAAVLASLPPPATTQGPSATEVLAALDGHLANPGQPYRLSQVVPAVLKRYGAPYLLDHAPEHLRLAAATLLVSQGDGRAIQIAADLLGSSDPQVVSSAAHALTKRLAATLPPVEDPQFPLLLAGASRVLTPANDTKVLERYGSAYLVDHATGFLKLRAANDLMDKGDPRGVSILTAALKDPDPAMRLQAAIPLMTQENAAAVQVVADLATSTNPGIKWSAQSALAKHLLATFPPPGDPLLPTMLTALEGTTMVNPAVLQKLQQRYGIEYLLDHGGPLIRTQTAITLADQGDPRGLASLIAVMNDGEPSLKLQAAVVLLPHGIPGALETVIDQFKTMNFADPDLVRRLTNWAMGTAVTHPEQLGAIVASWASGLHDTFGAMSLLGFVASLPPGSYDPAGLVAPVLAAASPYPGGMGMAGVTFSAPVTRTDLIASLLRVTSGAVKDRLLQDPDPEVRADASAWLAANPAPPSPPLH